MSLNNSDLSLTAGMSQGARIVGPGSILTLLIPVVTLIAAVWSGSLLFLNYVHVLTGGTWTGVALFMGLVMSWLLKGLRSVVSAEFIKKLVPVMLFLDRKSV